MNSTYNYKTAIATILLAIGIVFAGCKSKPDPNRIPPKVMKKLLLDINMAETLSTYQKDSTYKHGGAKNMDSLAVYYKDVFAHYNITQKQFTENLDWYKEHPDELDSLYTDILPVATGIQAAVSPLPAAATPPAPTIVIPGKK